MTFLFFYLLLVFVILILKLSRKISCKLSGIHTGNKKKTPKNEEKPNRGGRRLLSLKVYEKNILKNPRGFLLFTVFNITYDYELRMLKI